MACMHVACMGHQASRLQVQGWDISAGQPYRMPMGTLTEIYTTRQALPALVAPGALYLSPSTPHPTSIHSGCQPPWCPSPGTALCSAPQNPSLPDHTHICRHTCRWQQPWCPSPPSAALPLLWPQQPPRHWGLPSAAPPAARCARLQPQQPPGQSVNQLINQSINTLPA